MKRGKIVKWILIVYAAFFVFQFLGVFFAGLMVENREVTTYSDMQIGEITCTNIGNEYSGYLAKDGFTLYEVTTEITNTAVDQYTANSLFTYHADGAFSNGFKGGTYSESVDVSDMTECTLVYTNCPDYDATFGYDIGSIVPGGCTIMRRDIVEVPEQAVHLNIDTVYFGGEDYLITLN